MYIHLLYVDKYVICVCILKLLRILTVNAIPLLKDLNCYVVREYAADWKKLGKLLGVSSKEMEDVENKIGHGVERCCCEMLIVWLKNDPNSTWGNLLSAIESLSLSTSDDEGTYICKKNTL